MINECPVEGLNQGQLDALVAEQRISNVIQRLTGRNSKASARLRWKAGGLLSEPKKLRIGTDVPPPTMHEEESRVAVLQATVQHYLPEFDAAAKKAIEDAEGDGPVLVLHQDAFAAGYDDDEYTLLGMAVKYAGLHGVTVQIIGKNHETF